MKALRLVLLLLLAVLLPLRGAIAAAAPCAGDGFRGPASSAQAGGHAHQHHHHHSGGPAGEPASLHAHAGGHPHEHGDAGKCNLCASCCSAASLPATFSPAIAALEAAPASFAVVNASVQPFLSDGQERPPRSL